MSEEVQQPEVQKTPESAAAVPTAEIPEKVEAIPKLSKELQTFLKKEADWRKREDSFKSRQAELESKIAEYESNLKNYREVEEYGKTDPEAVLKLLGWDYDKLTQWKFKNPGMPLPPVIDDLKNEIKTLKQQLEEKELNAKKKEEEQVYNSKLSDFKKGMREFIEKNADEFELINKLGKTEEVAEYVMEYKKEHGKTLLAADAAREIEAKLEKEYGPLLNSLKSSKKFSTLFKGDVPLEKAAKEEQALKEVPKAAKSLTITAKDVGSSTTKAEKRAQSRQARIDEILSKIVVRT